MRKPPINPEMSYLLYQLFEHYGSKLQLAKSIGVSPSLVSHWIQRNQISFEIAQRIEEDTQGKFNAVELYNLRKGGFVTMGSLQIEQEQIDINANTLDEF